MPRSMLPEIGIRQTERSKNGKGFKGPGGENINNYGQLVMSVRTPEGFLRKSTRQVADVRKPLVSASHIIQVGNDLFIGNDDAYIVNRKKKEKSMLRKEGHVYVLVLFVWRSMQSIKSQTEESEGGGSCSTATAQLFDGRRSERGRRVQAN